MIIDVFAHNEYLVTYQKMYAQCMKYYCMHQMFYVENAEDWIKRAVYHFNFL